MQTLSLCNQRTNLHEPANKPFLQRRIMPLRNLNSRKFTVKLSPVQQLHQVVYHQKAKSEDGLKSQTVSLCN